MVHWLWGGLQWAIGMILILVVPMMLIVGVMLIAAIIVSSLGGGWFWVIVALFASLIVTIFLAHRFQKLIFNLL